MGLGERGRNMCVFVLGMMEGRRNKLLPCVVLHCFFICTAFISVVVTAKLCEQRFCEMSECDKKLKR